MVGMQGDQWLAKPRPKQHSATAKPAAATSKPAVACEGLKAAGVFFVVVFCLVPLVVFAAAMVFGAMLASAEGWSYKVCVMLTCVLDE